MINRRFDTPRPFNASLAVPDQKNVALSDAIQ
jgi:hypothetical protein